MLGLRMQAIKAQVGDIVGVHYKGTLDNGEIFDQNIGEFDMVVHKVVSDDDGSRTL
jgi:FKBP-type peptidyl-prolyl cis-trans isomerase